MTKIKDIEDDLVLFRDEMFRHYQGILAQFELDARSTVPDIETVSGNAAYLALMQVFLGQIDEMLPQLQEQAAEWMDKLQDAAAGETAQYFLREIHDLVESTLGDESFRAQILTFAQSESAYIEEQTFFAAFDDVNDWIKSSVERAPQTIQECKKALEGSAPRSINETPDPKLPQLN